MDLQILVDALISLVPPLLVGVLFYVIMRGILRADSKERKVYARMEAEMREARAVRNSEPVAAPTQPDAVKKAPKSAPKKAAKATKSTN